MPRVASHRRCPAGSGLAVIILILFAGVWGAGRTVHAQQQGQLFLSVLDADGGPVTDLEPGDVSVMVDDLDCRIVKLEPISKPMKVTLMIDNGSATTNVLSNLRTAVKGFLEVIPMGVEVEVLTTAPQPRYLEKFTTDREKLIKSVDRLAPDTGAALFFDALVEAAKRVEKDKSDYLPVFVALASDVGRTAARWTANTRSSSRSSSNAQSPCISSCSIRAGRGRGRWPARCRRKSASRSPS